MYCVCGIVCVLCVWFVLCVCIYGTVYQYCNIATIMIILTVSGIYIVCLAFFNRENAETSDITPS